MRPLFTFTATDEVGLIPKLEYPIAVNRSLRLLAQMGEEVVI